jgi:hypothetical protein
MTDVRRWLLVTLGAASAIAIAVLPSYDEITFPIIDPLRHRIHAAGWRWDLHGELYRREHSRALARQSLTAPSHRVHTFDVVRPPAVPLGFEHQMTERLTRTLRGIGVRDTTIDVRLVLTVDTGNVLDGVPIRKGNYWSTDIFPPGSVARDACIIVARAHGDQILREPREQSGEGSWGDVGAPCKWYAMYGRPGAGVISWLDSTDFAALRLDRVSRRLISPSYEPGWEYAGYGEAPDRMHAACSERETGACERIMLGRDESRAPTLRTQGWIGDRPSAGYGNPFATMLLIRLQRELGPELFATVWKSDQPLPVSVAAARGEPFEDWIHAHISAQTRGYKSGPIPRSAVLVAAVVFAAALFAVALAAVSRRQTFA